MSNLYLSTVLSEFNGEIEKLKNLHVLLCEFLSDSQHIDGIDGNVQKKTIEKAIKAVDEASCQMELVTKNIKEVLKNG